MDRNGNGENGNPKIHANKKHLLCKARQHGEERPPPKSKSTQVKGFQYH